MRDPSMTYKTYYHPKWTCTVKCIKYTKHNEAFLHFSGNLDDAMSADERHSLDSIFYDVKNIGFVVNVEWLKYIGFTFLNYLELARVEDSLIKIVYRKKDFIYHFIKDMADEEFAPGVLELQQQENASVSDRILKLNASDIGYKNEYEFRRLTTGENWYDFGH